MTFKDLHIKDKLSYILCCVSFTLGSILTFLGFFVNPLGIIDPSVLTSLGIFLSFSGALIGINVHYSTELRHFKSKVEYEINEKRKSKDTPTKNETE